MAPYQSTLVLYLYTVSRLEPFMTAVAEGNLTPIFLLFRQRLGCFFVAMASAQFLFPPTRVPGGRGTPQL